MRKDVIYLKKGTFKFVENGQKEDSLFVVH